MILCVTGTGTDVGKTIATAALAAVARRAGYVVRILKPIQTGEPTGHGDAPTVRRLTGIDDLHECARYPEPLAPVMAARRAGSPTPTCEDVAAAARSLDGSATLVLLEGAGGLLVDLGLNSDATSWTLADLAHTLAAPVATVTTTGLGSLNHALLTQEALHSRGIESAGLIGGSVPAEPDLATRLNLEEFSAPGGFGPAGTPWLGAIPAGAGSLGRAEFCEAALSWLCLPEALAARVSG